MRFNPTKLLQGLLYTTPVILLTLAACGGGGGDTPTTPSQAAAFTVGGAASGVLGSGVTLRNNGGNDLLVASGVASYTFNTPVVAGARYNVTVLTHPTGPTQRCSVTAASGTMPAHNVTNANVSCVTAFTVGGTLAGGGGISGLTGTGLVLQNNGGDNYLAASGVPSFTFSAPVADGDPYEVTVLAQPHTPAQTCIPTNNTGNVLAGNVTNVAVTCTTNATLPPPDQHVFVANFGSDNIWAYAASGVTPTHTIAAAGDGPYSIAVDPAGQFAYVVNYNADTVSAYSITGTTLTPLDMDAFTGGVQNTIATGNAPRAIAIDPSGKFAYVVNYLDNSVSAYSIDAAGVLARIDSDGATTANETSIPAKVGPVAIAIYPAGGYAYVANDDGNVSAYNINPTTGALTGLDVDGVGNGSDNTFIAAGPTPSSITIDPSGLHLYVTNAGIGLGAGVSGYHILPADGSLISIGGAFPTGAGPHSVAIHPDGGYAYVVNTNDHNVSIYSILDGTLTPMTDVLTGGSSPLSITIDSTGQYAYVANSGTNTISAFSINSGTGDLTPVGITDTGTKPYSVITSK